METQCAVVSGTLERDLCLPDRAWGTESIKDSREWSRVRRAIVPRYGNALNNPHSPGFADDSMLTSGSVKKGRE